MVTAREFQSASCQATLFTPDAEVSAGQLVTRLLPQWIGRFDAEPTVLPSAEGLPKDLPRVILEARSGEWRCEIASTRINIVWRRPATEQSPPSLTDLYEDLARLLLEYKRFLDSRVARLAAVINRFLPHDAPARFLATHFCREEWLIAPFNRPESFELHAHKTYALTSQLSVNSWVRNKTGTLTTNARPIILVEQDINTLKEEASNREFSEEEIEQFFHSVVPGFDETLALYYPGQPA
ncbi:MAG: hypothetical protein IMZ69_01075 [Spirochaetes bacterium]|nr:hypothetical protein [Spirochaetota bacterium]